MICGIDEAGRGCIAGQMVVAGVVLTHPVDGLMDSKKLSETKREALYEQIVQNSQYKIIQFSAQEIDNKGISKCINEALRSIKDYFSDREILFDGNSSFGVEGINTMVKADTKIAEVSAASILAKVTRDRDINAYALEYPHYRFEKHKGYLTKAHKEVLLEHGYTPIHRRSFKVKGMNA